MPESGLICAYLLDGGGNGQPLDWEGVRAWRPRQGVLWVHLQYELEDARLWLEEESGLDPVVTEALCAEATRPRVAVSSGGLLVVLRGVNTNPGADPEDMVSLRIWLEPGLIVTTRQRRLLSIDGLRKALEAGRGPTDAGGFLADVVERLVERIGMMTEEIDGRLVELEEGALGESEAGQHGPLPELRRQVIRIRRFLAPQRDALARLAMESGGLLDEAQRLSLRETNNLLTRYVEDLDAVRDRAVVVHEELLALQSERLNQRMYALSLVAGLFLPLGFLTGLLGINVGGIPGSDVPWGFTVVVVLLSLVALLQLLLFRWKRWL